MEVLKVSDGKYTYYFSTKSRIAEFFGKKDCSIGYAMKYGKEIDGYTIEWTDDDNVRLRMVDSEDCY